MNLDPFYHFIIIWGISSRWWFRKSRKFGEIIQFSRERVAKGRLNHQLESLNGLSIATSAQPAHCGILPNGGALVREFRLKIPFIEVYESLASNLLGDRMVMA